MERIKIRRGERKWAENEICTLVNYVMSQKTFADLTAALPNRPPSQVLQKIQKYDWKARPLLAPEERKLVRRTDPLSEEETQALERLLQQAYGAAKISSRLERDVSLIRDAIKAAKTRNPSEYPRQAQFFPEIIALAKQGKSIQEIQETAAPFWSEKGVEYFLMREGIREVPFDSSIASWATRTLGHVPIQSLSDRIRKRVEMTSQLKSESE